MRILQLISYYIPAYKTGGPVFSVHALNKALVRQGVSITVYSTNLDGSGVMSVPVGTPVDNEGVETWYFNSPFSKWEYSPDLCTQLRTTAGSFDLIHIHSILRATSYFGSRYARKAGVPYIISPRGVFMSELVKRSSWVKKAYISIIERPILARASAVHFTAEVEKTEYEQARLPSAYSFVVPNSVDLAALHGDAPARGSFRSKYGIPESHKLILSLGRLHWKKGFDVLIPSFANLLHERQDVILAIVGPDDGYAQTVENLISQHGLDSKVKLVGPLFGVYRASAFQDADVFTLPSYAENFAMVAVEALSFGVPVVVSRDVGICNYVEQYNAGRVVARGIGEVTAALKELLSDDKLRKEMGERGRLLVEREFGVDDVASKMLTEYSKVVQNKKHS